MSDASTQRGLVEGDPDFERKSLEFFSRMIAARPPEKPRIDKLLQQLRRLLGPDRVTNFAVVGCGPMPHTIQVLRDLGAPVVGIEPVPSFVKSANEFLGEDLVRVGAAEHIDLPDNSQSVVMFESVLEHVDSPLIAMNELYRVTRPGGVCVIMTTNRLRFSFIGNNGEYNVPFFNWLPRLLQECYVFDHLHHRPHLANYSTRPAVHWFSFADLCALGRTAGYAQFYSIIDLVRPEDPGIARSAFRRTVLKWVQRSPWLRALALTQIGDTIFMYKRK